MSYNKKLLYENKETDTSYYLAGYDSKPKMNDDTWWRYPNDVLLKGKCYKGFFKKKFAFTEFDFFPVRTEIKGYTFQQFKIDLLVMDNPKYITIYALRPSKPSRPKTQEEIDRDNETTMAIAACASNTAFL